MGGYVTMAKFYRFPESAEWEAQRLVDEAINDFIRDWVPYLPTRVKVDFVLSVAELVNKTAKLSLNAAKRIIEENLP